MIARRLFGLLPALVAGAAAVGLAPAGLPALGASTNPALGYGDVESERERLALPAGGLVFCAGTRDLKIRAFDAANGKELWEHKLPFGGFAPPTTYEVAGKQYLVVPATGGGKLGGQLGDAYVAFALPAE